ncbi:heterokaryon incompatibility protein-domain-containing protein [Podospora appendiculata]|uniref:Heterokaryon incompatibility protein-domain-containing protein n=1 Tax=Podospora appendiculata TaxID=314037 RepID=A0AAE0XAM7_9PEZI|nr:heterokaryon incompatibility protein-domain-containing protein [Podospora appendiculata]
MPTNAAPTRPLAIHKISATCVSPIPWWCYRQQLESRAQPRTMNQFSEYTILGERHFRLLHLLPRKETADTEPPMIECKLEVAHLDLENSFEALSYVWGSPNETRPILLEGHVFHCTKSLHTALSRLVLDDQTRVLWVDAICIDQSDLDERAEQVKHMRHIYQEAQSVLSFLGDPFDGIGAAIDYLCAAADDASIHLNPKYEHFLSVNNMDASSDQLSEYIVRLFNLPWWKRVWTVQEFCLAKAGSFYCGEHMVPVNKMTQGVANLLQHAATCCMADDLAFGRSYALADSDVELDVCDALLRLEQLQQAAELQPEALFHNTLLMFRIRLATDPRDKIYGLFGLAPYIGDLVTMDYAAPIEQVYETFTVAYINRRKNVHLLSALGGNRALPNLASFAPDWTIRPSDGWSTDEGWMLTLFNRAINNRAFFNASASTTAEWEYLGPGRARANAFIFDTICVAELEQINPLLLWETTQGWLKRIHELVKKRTIEAKSVTIEEDGDSYTREDHRRFLRTLCGDLIHGEDGIEEELVGDSPERIAMLEHWWAILMSSDLPSNVSLNTNDLQRSVYTVSQGRSFVITEKGYMGWADNHVQVGDFVAILAGGVAPFILSPAVGADELGKAASGDGTCTRRYRILGDAYIHGIMQGEAFRFAGRETGQFDELDLV